MDLIISDIYMPVMDGFKLRNAVREMPGWVTLPFLFLSGYDDQYTLEAVKDPKIEGFRKAWFGVFHHGLAAHYEIAHSMLFQSVQQFSEVWACQHVRT
jgi:CheY-like chemotaxis protein